MNLYGIKHFHNNKTTYAVLETSLESNYGHEGPSCVEHEIEYYTKEEIKKYGYQLFLTPNKEELENQCVEKLECNEYVFPKYGKISIFNVKIGA